MSIERPIISNYQDLARYLSDMIAFRKRTERAFSVLKICKTLRRVSPALVTLVCSGKRRLSLDRAEEFGKLLGLNSQERQYFRDWVRRQEVGEADPTQAIAVDKSPVRRKQTSSHILTDWINVYVKDAFQIERASKRPENIYPLLAGIASQKRIDKSIAFLLREGHLRKKVDGSVVPDVPLDVIDHKVPDTKVRQFHKATLLNAIRAVGNYPAKERYANALTVALTSENYHELLGLIEEFAEKLQDFSEKIHTGDRLYQLVINLSPTGGTHE
jgi:uncharacterized protein (TIGR02147 family)